MASPAVPQVRAIWESITYGTLCEGEACRPTCIEGRTVFYQDGTCVRSAYDALDPLRQMIESVDDRRAGERLLRRYQGLCAMEAPVLVHDADASPPPG